MQNTSEAKTVPVLTKYNSCFEAGKKADWELALSLSIIQTRPAQRLMYPVARFAFRPGYGSMRRESWFGGHILPATYGCCAQQIAYAIKGAYASGHFNSYQNVENALIAINNSENPWKEVFLRQFLSLLKSTMPANHYTKLIEFHTQKKSLLQELTQYSNGFFYGRHHRQRAADFVAECRLSSKEKINNMIQHQLLLFKPEGTGPSAISSKKHEQALKNRNQDDYFNLMTKFKSKFNGT